MITHPVMGKIEEEIFLHCYDRKGVMGSTSDDGFGLAFLSHQTSNYFYSFVESNTTSLCVLVFFWSKCVLVYNAGDVIKI